MDGDDQVRIKSVDRIVMISTRVADNSGDANTVIHTSVSVAVNPQGDAGLRNQVVLVQRPRLERLREHDRVGVGLAERRKVFFMARRGHVHGDDVPGLQVCHAQLPRGWRAR